MTDPKDELGARFDERRVDTTEDEETDLSDDIDSSGDSDNANNSNNTDNSGDAGDAGGKPGPDRDESATRHRRQVPMYLPDEKADKIDKLYERLDGRSKVAGKGGIEKHADFMETMVEFAVEHEDDLAERLGIGEKES